MGLLDTWREVRQQIIDSKPTYEPFITPQEYVSPFYTDTPEAEVVAAPAPSAPVYDQGLLYKRPLNLPTDSDEPQQATYEPIETTTQLQKLMEQTPTVNALSQILPGGILLNAANRSQIQNAANRIFGPNLQGGPFGWRDIIPFSGGDYEQRIQDTIKYSPTLNPSMPAYPMDWYEEPDERYLPEPSERGVDPYHKVRFVTPTMGGARPIYRQVTPTVVLPDDSGSSPTGSWYDAPSYDPASASFVDWDE